MGPHIDAYVDQFSSWENRGLSYKRFPPLLLGNPQRLLRIPGKKTPHGVSPRGEPLTPIARKNGVKNKGEKNMGTNPLNSKKVRGIGKNPRKNCWGKIEIKRPLREGKNFYKNWGCFNLKK